MTEGEVAFDPVIDADILDAVKDAADGPVFAVVEFTPTEFRIAYVSSATRALYEGEDGMRDYFATVHEYVNLDLAEIELFTESLFPMAEDVRYITTSLDIGKMIRVYLAEERGVFIALPNDAEVEPVVEALAPVMDQ